MSKFLYGIDFGTTNSALSIYDEDKKEIINTIKVPSLLYFLKEQSAASEELNYVVGEHAITSYLEDGMKGRFIKSIKQILSRSSFIETKIHHKRYNASDLVALILKDLKAKADEIVGYDCKKAIIGRPVFFDDDSTAKDTLAQTRLSKAAALAGFTDVRFQFEPIGAAFAYEKTITKKEKVLVADLGGGTTDFTYLILDPAKSGNKNRKEDMIASGGIYIGGDSFDSAFMWDQGTPHFGKNTKYEATPGKVLTVPISLFANICSWDQMNFFNGLRIKKDMENYYHYSKRDRKFKNLITLIDNNLGYSVFQAIEKTKIELSEQEISQFAYSNMEIEIDEQISLSQYNTIIQKDINKISVYLDEFMAKNEIKPEEIDSLFLTGGSSLVSGVQNLFKTKFPHISVTSGDNFTSVAKGLAYSGYLFED
ncbi:Hsp70 family protein [Pedobacter sp. MR2016-24]|uniref:Hsp70 family protein n=1 Tax=Pedobacter sp. MR2016-24 TaxID=2994466 RepID=UPI00224599BD|nr:Hsp70 family protein [Pedobacter sp. MR2016-24]MCX2483967.1 Hsp70 family protein [Pedobacter sp. MR2016-24]